MPACAISVSWALLSRNGRGGYHFLLMVDDVKAKRYQKN
jgi:hypothetical protein